ncbi:hypothetical protein STEG23_008010 [Scotinomys teguina]
MKACGPDAEKKWQVEAGFRKCQERLEFYRNLEWWTRQCFPQWECGDQERNSLSQEGTVGLSFTVLLVFQRATAERKSRDELAGAETTQPRLSVLKEIMDEVCDRQNIRNSLKLHAKLRRCTELLSYM